MEFKISSVYVDDLFFSIIIFECIFLLTHLLLIKEPAKKPAPKHMAAIAKDGSKKGKQETTNDESNSDDALSYDDVSIIFLFVCFMHSLISIYKHGRIVVSFLDQSYM